MVMLPREGMLVVYTLTQRELSFFFFCSLCQNHTFNPLFFFMYSATNAESKIAASVLQVYRFR